MLLHVSVPLYHLQGTLILRFLKLSNINKVAQCGPGISVGIAADYWLDGPGSNPGGDEIFRTCPDRPWGPPSPLQNGYRVFPWGKVRPGRAADHSPPSSAAVMEQYSYTFTHRLGHTGPVTGSLYFLHKTVDRSVIHSVVLIKCDSGYIWNSNVCNELI